ncbi:hypothetical protein JOD18_003917 [Gracilibacillus alcaliphilus]|nr:hypothetical protein [Gracilibacillus alcaliphilus]
MRNKDDLKNEGIKTCGNVQTFISIYPGQTTSHMDSFVIFLYFRVYLLYPKVWITDYLESQSTV